MIAGINAAHNALGRDAFILSRSSSYIGVLIEDIITKELSEPYRMFTSRAEYRLMLREDNADLRLSETAFQLGLVDEQRWQQVNHKREQIEKELARLKSSWVQPSSNSASQLAEKLKKPLTREFSQLDLLKRPELTYSNLAELVEGFEQNLDASVAEQVEIQAKYSGYIDRQRDEIERNKKQQNVKLPLDIDYAAIGGLSSEIVQKLNTHKPETIGQASRISGITPAAISLLLITLKKKNYKKVMAENLSTGN